MAKVWFDFQEEICNYFISLGFIAETNKIIEGVRTKHSIDVFVQTKFMGQGLKWIIEAKKWRSKINKLQVLGLRTIVDDIGADRGFIISDLGFQKGALEAAHKTNVTLLTFEDLKKITIDFVEEEILATYEERMKQIYRRYISHKKSIRRYYGLKLEHGEQHYSVAFVLTTLKDAIVHAKLKSYPINLDTILVEQHGKQIAENFQQLINWMNLNFNIIDKKILDAEMEMQKNGDFNPIIVNCIKKWD